MDLSNYDCDAAAENLQGFRHFEIPKTGVLEVESLAPADTWLLYPDVPRRFVISSTEWIRLIELKDGK